MATWADLDNELNRWETVGRRPTFWWRDDDAHMPTEALDRLLDLARRHSLPLHLAVVPAKTGAALSERLKGEHDIFTLQHGFAHTNHEPHGRGASEIGEHRALTLQLEDLRRGWEYLTEARLPRLLPALAPPWNRISHRTVGHLAGLGYRVLSTSSPRASHMPTEELTQVNIHVDPIRWKDGPQFRGEARILDGICRHLCDRRLGSADPEEPTGILTHHLQTDEDVWSFLDDVFENLSRRVRWVRLADLIEA